MTLSISFSNEASDGFADRIDNMEGWYVLITPQDGQPFEAVIVGSGQDETDTHGNGWHDAVRYRVPDDDGLAQPDDPTFVVRVKEVYIY